MMAVRIATFNLENLFARYRFRENFNPTAEDGFTVNNLAFNIYDETSKQITAKAIKKVDADIICLQEVESLPVLDRFNSIYLGGEGYRHRILIDGNDPRYIDIGILSRHPFLQVRSHRQERNQANNAFLFSRDCLEVELEIDGQPLYLYVNHFKSLIGGREETRPRREEQVERVAEIIDRRWSGDNFQGNFIVLGDFNDYVDDQTSLGALVNHPNLENVVDRLPEIERWTHFFNGNNEYRQLDYILLSEVLADANSNSPIIIRDGLPFRAELYTGDRLEGVGHDFPKASDHCPLAMDLDLI